MQPNKRHNGSRANERAGFTAKPARIVLTNGTTIDAVHHFVNTHGWLVAYETDRASGIDYKIPAENVQLVDTSDEDIRETTATASKRGEA